MLSRTWADPELERSIRPLQCRDGGPSGVRCVDFRMAFPPTLASACAQVRYAFAPPPPVTPPVVWCSSKAGPAGDFHKGWVDVIVIRRASLEEECGTTSRKEQIATVDLHVSVESGPRSRSADGSGRLGLQPNVRHGDKSYRYVSACRGDQVAGGFRTR